MARRNAQRGNHHSLWFAGQIRDLDFLKENIANGTITITIKVRIFNRSVKRDWRVLRRRRFRIFVIDLE